MAFFRASNPEGKKPHQTTRPKNSPGGPQSTESFSPELIRKKQITGFVRCLTTVFKIHSRKYNEKFLRRSIKDQLNNVSTESMAKIFKLSLATTFSSLTKQELPSDHEKSIKILPEDILRHYVKKRNQGIWTYVFPFAQDLLMCKGLANPVPDGMISQAYQDHRETMTSIGQSPENFLLDFKKVCRNFGEELRRCYDGKTTYPGKKGYFGIKRHEGGLRTALKDSLRLKGHRERRGRIDPIVLHIEGLPGIGKSKISNQVAKELSKMFGYNYSDIYNRTVMSDHWDGYRGQLISSIDDFGCSVDRLPGDLATLIQICSEQDFVLPMADLREKGKKFSSEFLFLSTNGLTDIGTYGLDTNSTYPPAVKRRVSPTFRLKRISFDKYIMTQLRYDPDCKLFVQQKSYEGDWRQISKILSNYLISEYDTRYSKIFQPVLDNGFGSVGYGYTYDRHPPDRLPQCEAHAIAEPLKVRMITKNEPCTWVLKPVQKAMWKALKKFKVFDLTSGPKIDLKRLSYGGAWLVSGDYKSATDKLHLDIMKTASQILKEYIPEELREWFIWESGEHEIHYPASTQLESCIQTRGQLMGSLLSFPILCLANFTTYARAKVYGTSFDIESVMDDQDIPCFINGDDILFTCNGPRSKLYRRWKLEAKSIGLELSIGKTYISQYFGLINSQMILRYGQKQAKNKPWTILKTYVQLEKFPETTLLTSPILVQMIQGKVKQYCKTQESGTLDFSSVLTYIPRDIIVNLNKKVLSQTPESLDLPRSLGGIGVLKEGYKPNLIDKEIYFFKALKNHGEVIHKIDDGLVVTRVAERIENRVFSTSATIPLIKPYNGFVEEDYEEEYPPIFPWKDFKKFLTFYKKTKLREIIRDCDLLNLPSLDQFKMNVRLVDIRAYKKIVKFSHNLFKEMEVSDDER